MKRKLVVPLVVALVGGLIALFVLRGSSPEIAPAAESPPIQAPLPESAPPPAAPVAPPAQPRPAPSPVPPSAPREARVQQLSEQELMTKLRELGASNPAESLALAREGNRRFKNSAEAPERASLIVKALSNLDRKDEARAEALKMEKDYPKSPFTDDVHRHMFVNPPTHPAERGFGKKSELE